MVAGDDPILSKVAEFMKNYSNQLYLIAHLNYKTPFHPLSNFQANHRLDGRFT